MSTMSARTKKRVLVRLVFMGIISLLLYWVLLSEQGIINKLFTRGGLYAFLPIAAAFIFSYVHGSFTGHFWSALGIEAAKKREEVK